MLGDIGNQGAADLECRVVPAHGLPGRVVGTIEAAGSKSGEVETSDKGKVPIDHHDLFVMAMKKPLFGVDRELHAGVSGESSRQCFGLSATRPERRRQGRAPPKKNPHFDPASGFDDQVFKGQPRILAQQEVVFHVPAGDVYERTRREDGLDDCLEGLLPINVDLEGVTFPRGCVSDRPGSLIRFESTVPADLGESPAVMASQHSLEAIPERAVHLVQRVAPAQAQPSPLVCQSPTPRNI